MLFDHHDYRELEAEDKAEILLEFMFTGTTSVTSTMSWMLYHIAEGEKLESGLQDKLYEESKACLSPGGKLRISGTGKAGSMPCMDAVIRETLRLYAPIHMGRYCPQEAVPDHDPEHKPKLNPNPDPDPDPGSDLNPGSDPDP